MSVVSVKVQGPDVDDPVMLIVYTPGWAKVWLAMTFGAFAVLGPTVLIVWAEEESPQLMVICCCVAEQLPLDTRALAAVGSLLVHSLIWPPKTHWLDGTWVVLPAGAEDDASEWLPLMTDPLLAQSAIDRLTSTCHELIVEGDSYRRRQRPAPPPVDGTAPATP